MFKYLNTPSKGSRHTDYTFVTEGQISHLLQKDRFHICHRTEALTDTAFYSLGYVISTHKEGNVALFVSRGPIEFRVELH